MLVLQKLDVSCSTNPGIEVLVFDFEVDVEPEQHLGFQVAQNIFGHLSIFLTLVLVFLGAFANLNPCRIERCILILPRANENDVLEPLKTFEFAKFVEAGVLDVFGIAHAQLRERHRLTPLLQKPHASVE